MKNKNKNEKDLLNKVASNIFDKTAIEESKNKWESKSKEQKRKSIAYTIIIYTLLAISIVYLCYYDPINNFFTNESAKITNSIGKWIVSSIPKLFSSFTCIIINLFLISFVRTIVVFTRIKKQKTRTITNLVASFAKYALWITCLLCVLAVWGVNTAGIIASAGIVTLIIGLGSQSIVGDLVAGVFIVFEGNLEVGDMVTYEEFKGTIKEIGLRITVIESWQHDVQIVRNSEIKHIINNSKKSTELIAEIAVPNKVSTLKVEEILIKNLPYIKEKCPKIKGDIKYVGTVKNNAFATIYGLLFDCAELDSYQTKRDVIKFAKIALEKEGIFEE